MDLERWLLPDGFAPDSGSGAWKREHGPQTAVPYPADCVHQYPGGWRDPAHPAALRRGAIRGNHSPDHAAVHFVLRCPVPGSSLAGTPIGPLRSPAGADRKPDGDGAGLHLVHLCWPTGQGDRFLGPGSADVGRHDHAIRGPHPGWHHRGQHYHGPSLHHRCHA